MYGFQICTFLSIGLFFSRRVTILRKWKSDSREIYRYCRRLLSKYLGQSLISFDISPGHCPLFSFSSFAWVFFFFIVSLRRVFASFFVSFLQLVLSFSPSNLWPKAVPACLGGKSLFFNESKHEVTRGQRERARERERERNAASLFVRGTVTSTAPRCVRPARLNPRKLLPTTLLVILCEVSTYANLPLPSPWSTTRQSNDFCWPWTAVFRPKRSSKPSGRRVSRSFSTWDAYSIVRCISRNCRVLKRLDRKSTRIILKLAQYLVAITRILLFYLTVLLLLSFDSIRFFMKSITRSISIWYLQSTLGCIQAAWVISEACWL